MLSIEQIRGYFPPVLSENPRFQKYLLKEYILLLILDYLSATKWIKKLSFIGGTNLRLIKGIDRFSEDIDFDCKDFSKQEFLDMTDAVLLYLERFGFNIELRRKESEKLSAYRRSIYFPHLLFDLRLSKHREERFLIKIECVDQQYNYKSVYTNVKGCGFYFNFPVPSDQIMCAMKISALLTRSKGRDFYDVMFLMNFTTPDYNFLKKKLGIENKTELKSSFLQLLSKINLEQKVRDFEHLVFEKRNSKKILSFSEFVQQI